MKRVAARSRVRSGIAAIVVCALPAGNAALAQLTCRTAHLSTSDGSVYQSFGFAVDVSGNIVVVGEPENIFPFQPGSASVHTFDGTAWVFTQELLASDGQGGDWFGYAVAIDGDTAMVGALQHVHSPSQSGSVYVFRFDEASWTQQQELLATGGQFGDAFGESVALSGDVAVIGAYADDDNGAQSGSAYVFRFNDTRWVQEQKLLASDGAAGDFFGDAVAVFGDVAIIGAHNNANLFGAAYVFRFNGTSWVQEQKLLASDGSFVDLFGYDVSISGDIALVGSPYDDDNGSGSGSAYVFRFDQTTSTWVQAQKLVASDGSTGDQFGRYLAIEGDTAVVGAWMADIAGVQAGAAYVFRTDGGSWTEHEKLVPDPGPWTAFFGWGVAMSGDTAVIGAHGEDSQSGAAYVYAGLSGTDCNATGRADACDIFLELSQDDNSNGVPDECECPWDLDGSGTVGILDFLGVLTAWDSNPGGPPDFDGDGTVGILDFLTLLANWGPCA